MEISLNEPLFEIIKNISDEINDYLENFDDEDDEIEGSGSSEIFEKPRNILFLCVW